MRNIGSNAPLLFWAFAMQGCTAVIQGASPALYSATISLSAPSLSLVNHTKDVSYTVTYVNAGSITLSSNDIAVESSSNASCSVSVTSDGSLSSRTVVFSDCQGDGSMAFHVAAGSAKGQDGRETAASSTSARFQVDNTAPSAVSANPTSTNFDPALGDVVLHFDNDLDDSSVSASDFNFSTTCAGGPSLVSVTTENAASTLHFNGTSNCLPGEGISIALDLSDISDKAGNAGTGTLNLVFTRQPVGPSSATFSPITSTRNPLPTAVTVTYNKNVKSSTVSAADFSLGGTCGGASISSVTAAGDTATATVNISAAGCTNGQSVILNANFAGIDDVNSVAGASGSASVTYTFDNVGPTISHFSPTSSTVTSLPTQVDVTLNADVNSATVTAADFALTGSCSSKPSIGAVTVVAGVATVPLVGGSCGDTENLTLTADLAGISDLTLPSGNVGSGSSAVTYTLDTSGPVVTSYSPLSGSVATIPSSIDVNFSNDTDMSTVTINTFALSGTCSSLPSKSGMSKTGSKATLTLSGGTCNDGEHLVLITALSGVKDLVNNAGSTTPDTAVYTRDTGPTVLSFSPGAGAYSPTDNPSGTLPMPTSVVVTFSAATDMSTVVLGTFSIPTETCEAGPVVSAISKSGQTATLTIDGADCRADGTFFDLQANLSSVKDIHNISGSGTTTARYAVDAQGLTTATFSPVDGSLVVSLPFQSSITFESDIFMDPNWLDPLSGGNCMFAVNLYCTCSSAPSITAVSLVGNVATYTIGGGTCVDGDTCQVAVDLSLLTDLAGNGGWGTPSATYTFATHGPNTATASPATASFNPMPTSITFSYPASTDLSTVGTADFAVSGSCTGLPTITGVNNSSGNAVVTLSGQPGHCNDSDTLIITNDLTGVRNTIGQAGIGSASVTYTYDGVGPSVAGIWSNASPGNSGGNAQYMFDVIDVDFSEDIKLSSVSNADFTLTGNCTTMPTLGSANAGNPDSHHVRLLFTANGVCNTGQSMTVTIHQSGITDLAGNPGIGDYTVTWTKVP